MRKFGRRSGRVAWGSGAMLALLLLLPSCGAGVSCPPGEATNAVLIGVPTLQDVGNFWGLTEFGCHDSATVVKISFETPDSLVGRVVAHELLHVAGLVDHEESAACYLHETIYPAQTIAPCDQEIERLLDVTKTYEIRVLAAYLVEHARGAANLWNDYAGREVFVIVDDSPPSDEG